MGHSQATAQQIRAAITELKDEQTALEHALAALETPKPRRTTNGQSKPKVTTRPRAVQRSRPTPKSGATVESVLGAVEQGTDEAAVIAKQFGVSLAVVRNRLQQLEQAGRVTRTGNKRSTRWLRQAA
jgi:predicted Rossmann fold nucleotide-binding protein DprA/Smf involved in DNA uptake